MKTLSAREMFKEEEKIHGVKSYWQGEQRVNKYRKINKNTAYRIIERIKWIGTNSRYDIEVLTLNEDKTYNRTSKSFYNETEVTGGRIIGKQYKDALDYVNEYIKELCKN